MYYGLINALNISSGANTAIFHSQTAYDAQNDRLRHLSAQAYFKIYAV